MQQLEAVATAEEAVCAYIDRITNDVTNFKNSLYEALADAGELGVEALQDCCRNALTVLQLKLIQCEAVTMTHHDLLDNAGRTSYLHQVTATQDDISQCLETIGLLLEISL